MGSEEEFPAGPPAAYIRGHLVEGLANNAGEYCGLIAGMRRAVRHADSQVSVFFDVDSKLVAMQMSRFHRRACRATDLLELHDECVGLGNILDLAGVVWSIRHIYREYNQTSDSLANAAIDDHQVTHQSESW